MIERRSRPRGEGEAWREPFTDNERLTAVAIAVEAEFEKIRRWPIPTVPAKGGA